MLLPLPIGLGNHRIEYDVKRARDPIAFGVVLNVIRAELRHKVTLVGPVMAVTWAPIAFPI